MPTANIVHSVIDIPSADLDQRVTALGEVQHLRQVGPWLRRGGGVRGCMIARWSMMNRVAGWRSGV
jgi:hypothetical protein